MEWSFTAGCRNICPYWWQPWLRRRCGNLEELFGSSVLRISATHKQARDLVHWKQPKHKDTSLDPGLLAVTMSNIKHTPSNSSDVPTGKVEYFPQHLCNYISHESQTKSNVLWSRASVCVCVCLSAAACPHYCTDPDVTWGSGRRCPLVVHYWADLQSVHGLRCYGNTMEMRGRARGNLPGPPHAARMPHTHTTHAGEDSPRRR